MSVFGWPRPIIWLEGDQLSCISLIAREKPFCFEFMKQFSENPVFVLEFILVVYVGVCIYPCKLFYFKYKKQYALLSSSLLLTYWFTPPWLMGSLLWASPQEGREPGKRDSFNQLCCKGEEVRGKWGKARQGDREPRRMPGRGGQLFSSLNSRKRSGGRWDLLLLLFF